MHLSQQQQNSRNTKLSSTDKRRASMNVLRACVCERVHTLASVPPSISDQSEHQHPQGGNRNVATPTNTHRVE